MPPETKMQSVGLTIYPYHYGLPVRDIGDITETLNEIGATDYWLEEYHSTFRTTKIRIRTTEDREADYELVCTSTIRIELPIDNGWNGIIAVKQQDDEIVELSDNENSVLVVAGSVALHAVGRT